LEGATEVGDRWDTKEDAAEPAPPAEAEDEEEVA
jgi:hypothetical protein